MTLVARIEQNCLSTPLQTQHSVVERITLLLTGVSLVLLQYFLNGGRINPQNFPDQLAPHLFNIPNYIVQEGYIYLFSYCTLVHL